VINFNTTINTTNSPQLTFPSNFPITGGTSTAALTNNQSGIGLYWNETEGQGETDIICYGQGSAGGLSIWGGPSFSGNPTPPNTTPVSQIADLWGQKIKFYQDVSFNQNVELSANSQLQFFNNGAGATASIFITESLVFSAGNGNTLQFYYNSGTPPNAPMWGFESTNDATGFSLNFPSNIISLSSDTIILAATTINLTGYSGINMSSINFNGGGQIIFPDISSLPYSPPANQAGFGLSWNKAAGSNGETDIICYGQTGQSGLTIWGGPTNSSPPNVNRIADLWGNQITFYQDVSFNENVVLSANSLLTFNNPGGGTSSGILIDGSLNIINTTSKSLYLTLGYSNNTWNLNAANYGTNLSLNFIGSSINISASNISLTTYGTLTFTTYNGNINFTTNNGSTNFNGVVTAPTPSSGDNSTNVATTAFVKSYYATLSGSNTFTNTNTFNGNIQFASNTGIKLNCAQPYGIINFPSTFPTTAIGNSTAGIGFFWNNITGTGETDIICYGQGGQGGLTIWGGPNTTPVSRIADLWTDQIKFYQAVTCTSSISASTFSTTSDYRIKENVTELNETYSVDNLRPVEYENKITNKQSLGFIAHEVQEQYPFLVTGEKDGKENQSINYQEIIPILVKEIQDLKKRVTLLENCIKYT